MKMTDMRVIDFLDVLASDAPAPGGGSVSALAGAQGVALTMMVANLTNTREKYAEFFPLCETALREGAEIYKAFIEGIDKDTEAFNKVSAAYKLPKESEEEKKARSRAIGEATLAATEVPFETMRLCEGALGLTKSLVGNSNPNLSSDLGVAALNIKSALLSSWLNVKINLPSIKDEGRKAYFTEEGEKLLKVCCALADEIYNEISSLY